MFLARCLAWSSSGGSAAERLFLHCFILPFFLCPRQAHLGLGLPSSMIRTAPRRLLARSPLWLPARCLSSDGRSHWHASLFLEPRIRQELGKQPQKSKRHPLLNILVDSLRISSYPFQNSAAVARVVTRLVYSPLPPGTSKTVSPIPCDSTIFESSPTPECNLSRFAKAYPAQDIPGHWIDATNSDPSKIILYMHGGAYFLLSPRSHQILTGLFARFTGSRVLSIDYSLAPERPFPCALRDAISAYRFLIDPPPGATHPRYDPKNIVFAGDSAGGGLAIAAALWLRDDGRWPLPGGLAVMSPWLDLTHSMPSFDDHVLLDILPKLNQNPEKRHFYTTNDLLDHPYVSPLFATKIPTKPLPPTLITVGSAERLRDEGIMFWSKFKGRCLPDDRLDAPHQVVIDPENMSDSGSESDTEDVRIEVYQDMPHVFQMFPFERLARMSVRRISDFITAVQRTDTGSSKVDTSSPGAPGSKASSPDGSCARVGGSGRNRITFIRHNGDVVV
ncbi:Alpha/Beta hydrolase protein [Polychytrium aggregatum]|uniref:Alpha/Beta hydrolase protein n=1 Tax=Polychytrium aggregatum TaxID=110093 RepID=UPI0022FEE1E2|nr:Alpha/Beta hydrolase protein [Polychytrium aggregatum]KAI9208728.1 Alpha/Beta hydrolase protein [Polychytrium aggregatum]